MHKERKASIIMKFPEHHLLYITHNEHRTNYESIEQYLKSGCMNRLKDMNPEDVQKCIETDSIWEIQWYPRTPISFHWVGAATLERCFEIIATSQFD